MLHFAYEAKEVCELTQLIPKPLYDFGVQAHKTWAKVSRTNGWLDSKVYPRDMHPILKASVKHLIFKRQGNKRRYTTRNRRKSEHN